jgi:hypothetical protein
VRGSAGAGLTGGVTRGGARPRWGSRGGATQGGARPEGRDAGRGSPRGTTRGGARQRRGSPRESDAGRGSAKHGMRHGWVAATARDGAGEGVWRARGRARGQGKNKGGAGGRERKGRGGENSPRGIQTPAISSPNPRAPWGERERGGRGKLLCGRKSNETTGLGGGGAHG